MVLDARWGPDSGYSGDGSVQPGAPAEVAGGGGVMPGVCPERADRAKKSLKMLAPRRRQR